MQPRLRLDIGWRDLISILAPLSAPREALEARVAAFAPDGTTAVIGLSVRTLFDALLAETAAGRPVVMSAVNIEGLARLAAVHGCEVRAVDIDLSTLAPDRGDVGRAARGAAMVVLAHLYGRQLPEDRLRRPAGVALLVEDRAQAFDGGLEISPAADVALYSFGPIKAATALGGGIALFHDPDLGGRVAARLDRHRARSEGWFLRRACKYAILKAASAPLIYGRVIDALRLAGRDPDAAIGGMARGFSGDLPGAVRHAPPLRMLRLLARRLERWGEPAPASEAAARAVSDLASVPGLQARGRWWVLPIRHRYPDQLVRALRRRGLDATRGATSLRATGEAPAASRLMSEVVYLPVPADTAAADRLRQRLAGALKEIS